MRIPANNKGFVLVETLIYLTLTVVLLTMVVVMLVRFSRINDDLRTAKAIHETAVTLNLNIENTMRTAAGIDGASSVFATSTGTLAFSMNPEGTQTRVFELSGDDVIFSENGSSLGPLNPENIRVTSLYFTRYTEDSADAVRVELTLEGDYRGGTQEHIFRTTYIPRNIYEQ